MSKNKLNINLEKKDDEVVKPTSAPSPDDKVVYEKQAIDPEAKAKRNRSIIRWVAAITIIGLIIFLIVWSCTPKYHSITSPTVSISDDGTSLQLDEDGNKTIDYTVDLSSTNKSWAYYYQSQGDGGQAYVVHSLATTGKEIAFKMVVYREGQTFTYHISNFESSEETSATFIK
ncbi:MAG: hypothetical protein MJ223_01125 [Mycoplasmoidaceae bacterium]|nr:hypothetical protein [Mycoplasmoidaceae bacterium]